MQLEFDDYHEGAGAELVCPVCQGSYLHHGAVEVFDRNEDATKGLHVLIENETVTADGNLDGNPSSRRHGLRIAIECECGEHFSLKIAQHKGQTYMDLIPVPGPIA
jgi:hypothetical protein